MLQNKWLRFVCCVFVLPLTLVFSMPGAAVAAESEVQSFTLDASLIQNTSGAADAECTLTLAIGGTSSAAYLIVGGTSSCDAGVDLSPSWCVGFEYQCSTYSIEIIGEGGLSCGGDRGLASGKGSQDGMSKVHTALGPGEFSIGACDPVEICLTGHITGHDSTDCNSTTLDPPEVPDVAPCPAAGNVSFGSPQIISKSVGEEANNWRGRVVYSGFAPPPPTGTMSWKFYYLLNPGPAQGNATRTVQGGAVYGIGHTNLSRPAGTPGGFVYETVSPLLTTSEAAWDWVGSQQPVGIGLYGIVGGEAGLSGSLFNVPTTHAGNLNQTGLVGITDPSKCSYYWGEKVANHSDVTSTKDDPIGPVIDTGNPTLPEPDPIPDPVGDDPDTGNWWDFLGPLFERLIRAVGDVARAIGEIVQAVMDGLMALLIPDPASWGIDELVDQLQSKPPFSLLEPLADEALEIGASIGGAGDCGSLADFSGGGIPIHVDCADVRNAPGMDALYQLVKVGLLALTGLYIFRMFSELLQEGQ